MATANSRLARYDIDEPETALHAETKLRLELEDRLRRTQEEFQEFILNAAHDLREPVRMVNAYCELLTRKDPQRTELEARQLSRCIQDGTSKLQALIAGMAEYATAGADPRYVLRFDLNDAFSEAVKHPVADPARPRPLITCDPLPFVRGDFEKVVRVFRHLIDNAEKYCEQPPPRIHVSSGRDGADWITTVQDNGPGIDPAYHGRIFAPFKRLHGRQYPGVGLGLAYCQKVVESHGGRMWVQSGVGTGAAFCFTLPAAD